VSQPPKTCYCCGRGLPRHWEPARLINRQTREPGELLLCAVCLSRPFAMWRLRWATTELDLERGPRR
jgi:hypothetical protein